MAIFSQENLEQTLKKSLGGAYTQLVRSAFQIAYQGHNGQFRERASVNAQQLPYIVHPVGVALLANELFELEMLFEDKSIILAASLTHDLLEDTDVTAEQLALATSGRTLELVQALTKPTISENLSRYDRNALLITQIAKSGKAASFLKVCDLLQNISRPSNTPPELLRKAIERGKTSYGILFELGGLSPELRERFDQKLAAAEIEMSKLSRTTIKPEFGSVEEVLDFCSRLGSQKVLELHDIVEALKSATGASIASYESMDRYLGMIFPKSKANVRRREVELAKNALLAGSLDLGQFSVETKSEVISSLNMVLCCNLELDEKNETFLFLGFSGEPNQIWKSARLLQLLSVFLTNRLRAMNRNRRLSLNNAIVRYGLDLNADDLNKVNYQEAQLKSLRALLEWAEFSRAQILSAIEFAFSKSEQIIGLEKIESRVKTPTSILTKMARRNLGSHFDLEDIVGIRLVCSTIGQSIKMADSLAELLRSGTGFSRKLEILHSDVPITRDVETAAGYRAKHITLTIRPSGTDVNFRIGCEIQIRSLYQDAWARASHRLAYSSHRNMNDALALKLKRLSALSHEADVLLEE